MSLVLKNVSYRYEGVSVLQNLSFTVSEGQRVAIMGASGRGKTTLLHLMAGLLAPQEGEITGIPAAGVSVVFQEDRLLPWATVLENLRVAAPKASGESLVGLLEELGLSGWESTRPGALSGGMARRVAIARALAFGSSLLLLDEPFSGLDSVTKGLVARVICGHSVGHTLVVVVHDEGDAILLGAEVIRI